MVAEVDAAVAVVVAVNDDRSLWVRVCHKYAMGRASPHRPTPSPVLYCALGRIAQLVREGRRPQVRSARVQHGQVDGS